MRSRKYHVTETSHFGVFQIGTIYVVMLYSFCFGMCFLFRKYMQSAYFTLEAQYMCLNISEVEKKSMIIIQVSVIKFHKHTYTYTNKNLV